MRLRNLVLFLALFVVLFLIFAPLVAKAQSRLNRFPAMTAAAGTGEEMYFAYCAECHGRDGKGGRPTAVTFGAVAPNLTTLAKKNDGRFPYAVVKDAIRGEDHGELYAAGQMPPWGLLFRYVGSGGRSEVEMRINRLTEYIRSLQEK
jgi:mono/diheme cytochrome c family protein